MSGYFAQMGKPLMFGGTVLNNGTLSAALFSPKADEWTDVYGVTVSTDETAAQSVTVSDGTTTLQYYVGGATGGANPPMTDQASIPVRFKKGGAITATAGAVTAGKHISVQIRGLTSKT